MAMLTAMIKITKTMIMETTTKMVVVIKQGYINTGL